MKHDKKHKEDVLKEIEEWAMGEMTKDLGKPKKKKDDDDDEDELGKAPGLTIVIGG